MEYSFNCPEFRLMVYENIKENFPKFTGFCKAINNYLSDISYELWLDFHQTYSCKEFPEIFKHRPFNRTDNDHWFYMGGLIPERLTILNKAIEEVKEIIRQKEEKEAGFEQMNEQLP